MGKITAKRRGLGLAFFLMNAALTPLTAAPAWAEAALATISVTGEGRVDLVPDMALVSLGLTSVGATAAEAMAGNSAQMEKLLAALAAEGIAPGDVQTAGLSLSPQYDNEGRLNEDGSLMITGFVASNMVNLRVRDVPALGKLVGVALAEGANTLNGLSFTLANPRPEEDEARRLAVADAKARAEVLAQAAGLALGPVQNISEFTANGPIFAAFDKASGGEMAVPIAEGEVSVRMSVSVTYQVLP